LPVAAAFPAAFAGAAALPFDELPRGERVPGGAVELVLMADGAAASEESALAGPDALLSDVLAVGFGRDFDLAPARAPGAGRGGGEAASTAGRAPGTRPN
jgi:hypothetical protein